MTSWTNSLKLTFSLTAIGTMSVFLVGLTSEAQVATKGAQPLPAHPQKVMSEAEINQMALQQTQQVLTNPEERRKALQADPQAAANDAKVQKVLGAGTQEAYELSSQLMSTIVAQTGGDPQKMQQLMLELQSNPHALEKLLTPAQREQIRRMASDLEARKGSAPVSGGGK